jgi:NADPH-dependent curcumin reductase CurA
MQLMKAREARLESRPSGAPVLDNFEVVEVTVPEPGEGEVLVRNAYFSIEPYMRGRMNAIKSYVPPYEIGQPMTGGAVGKVVASRAPELPVGTSVQSDLGWREYAVGPAKLFRKIDVSQVPASAYLGILGIPGITAYVGLHDIGGLKSDDVLFISSAAGAVGSLAGQLAKLAGATVIGSAGSAAKVAYLKEELGFDAAFDYHGADIKATLTGLAPNGITLYFDNVGGEQLEGALSALRPFGRIVACGMISQYNAPTHGPRNLALVIGKRLTLRGFIVMDHQNRWKDYLAEAIPLVRDGRLKLAESVVDGIESAPQAFIDFLQGGKYLGKLLIRTSPEERS